VGDDAVIRSGDEGEGVGGGGEVEQAAFDGLGEAVSGGDLEEGGVEGGIGRTGVEPAAGEVVAVAGARGTDREVHRRLPLSLSLAGSVARRRGCKASRSLRRLQV